MKDYEKLFNVFFFVYVFLENIDKSDIISTRPISNVLSTTKTLRDCL